MIKYYDAKKIIPIPALKKVKANLATAFMGLEVLQAYP
jgi:hypothetical protein